MWERLITQPIILSRYLVLLFVPVADFLTLESNIFVSKNLLSPPITILANLFIFILIFVSLLFWKKYPLISFSIIFYFINHLMESTVIGLELYFEHRNYLPSIFIYLVLSFLWFSIYIYFKNKNRHFLYSLFVFLMSFIVICEGNATYLRNEVWKDEISLNLDNIEKAPLSLRGYNNLAAEYLKLGRIDEAREYLKQAQNVYNENPERYQNNQLSDLYFNAGLIQLHGKNDIERAVKLLLKSVELNSFEFPAHYQLAIAFYKLGDMINAENAILNASQLVGNRPQKAQVYNLFGRILYDLDKFDSAIDVLKIGLNYEKSKDLNFNLAATYLRTGDYKRARSVLLSMDSGENDLLYLLYRLTVATGSEIERLVERIIFFINEKQLNYCEWIQEINQNNNVRVIYPDISHFSHILDQALISELNDQKVKIDSKINMIIDRSENTK
jgi:tetratricopeptide (TPR) repeat protein